MPTATLPITGDPAADDLLVTDPLALVIGMLLDQQVPMEWAFRGPATLRGRLGSLDAKRIAAMSPDEVEAVFRQKPALHRYPASMAKRTYALATHLVENYDGDASAIWTRETLPAGWGDTYFQSLPGQSFDITDLPNGTYFIQVQADPTGEIYERSSTNDTQVREVILGGVPGNRTVTVPPWHGIDTG